MFSKLAVAAMLLATPAFAHSAPAPAQAEASAPTRFTVTVEGEGPDVILIPGLMSSRAVWDEAVAGLGGRYRVHRVQVGGFAGEPARGNAEGGILPGIVEELHAYIQSNRLQRPAIVGHSMGGLLALMLAQNHPADVGKAMIVDALPFYAMLFGESATVESVKPQAAAFRDMVAGASDEAFRAQQPQTMASLVKSEAGRAKAIADALASDRKVAAQAIYEDMITDVRPGLAATATPLTIVYALNEVATEERFGRLYRGGYSTAPNVTFVPIADSYHFVMHDQPAAFAEALAKFLAPPQ